MPFGHIDDGEIRHVMVEDMEIHPEDGLQPNGTDIITDEGNRFSPYFRLSYSEGDWVLGFEISSDTGDGYIL